MLRGAISSAATRGLRYASTSRTSPDPNSPSRQKLRRVVLTGAFAVVTAVGAVTGARLKDDKDVVKQREKVQEMPIADRIAMIDTRRAELLRAKEALDRKLERLQQRMRADAAAAAAGGGHQQRD